MRWISCSSPCQPWAVTEHGRDLASAEAALDIHRGVLAYVWGQPMVTLAAMIAGARDLGIGACELWIFDQGLQVNQRLLTGNHEVVYAFAWFDLDRDGPVDIDLPPGPFMGTVLDAWHRPIVDLGRAGPDRGLGGRYRIVPPGDSGGAGGRYRSAAVRDVSRPDVPARDSPE